MKVVSLSGENNYIVKNKNFIDLSIQSVDNGFIVRFTMSNPLGGPYVFNQVFKDTEIEDVINSVKASISLIRNKNE